ncbi:3'-5' exonuclease [Catellatospora citrea]|uniref:3'-5' exonuclease n=1 Tax=Catellatospora citrea TaxID=53366 RepID=UPI0033CEB706
MAERLRNDPELAATTFIVIDFEATTPTGARPEPIDVAAIHMRLDGLDWHYVHEFTELMRPPAHAPVTPFDTMQTGITAQMVAAARPATAVLGELDQLMDPTQQYMLVAHNAHTEAGMINDYKEHCPKLAHTDLLDTVRLAKALLPDLGSHKLDAMLAHFGIAQPPDRHRALPDVQVTAAVFAKLLAFADQQRVWPSMAQVRRAGLIVSKSNRPQQDSLFGDLEATP